MEYQTLLRHIPTMDGLSTTVSIISVAGAAYASSKLLYDMICCFHNAKETFAGLKTDIEIISRTIESIKQNLEKQKTNVDSSKVPEPNLSGIKLALEETHKTCERIREEFDSITHHSKNGYTSRWRTVKLHFQENKIKAFQDQLERRKSSLSMALGSSS